VQGKMVVSVLHDSPSPSRLGDGRHAGRGWSLAVDTSLYLKYEESVIQHALDEPQRASLGCFFLLRLQQNKAMESSSAATVIWVSLTSGDCRLRRVPSTMVVVARCSRRLDKRDPTKRHGSPFCSTVQFVGWCWCGFLKWRRESTTTAHQMSATAHLVRPHLVDDGGK
jgi:hypothetical protein